MTDKKQTRDDVVVLKNVRLSFPHLFTPRASIEGGPERYRAAFLMDPETPEGKANIKKLEAAFDKAALKEWKEKAKADKIRAKLSSDRAGLRDGDDATNQEGDVYAGYEGMVYLSASNGKRPKVLDRAKNIIDSKDEALIYGGCYVNAVVSVWATSDQKRGGNGLFATLEIVQFVKDGEPFGAAALNEDDYLDAIEDDDDDLV